MPDWFTSTHQGSPARVFCFPYAGGNPRMFLNWQPQLADDAEIIAVNTQGRDGDVEKVIEGATEAIRGALRTDHRPVYLFGHSLGALIAFEVARRLERDQRAQELRHLIASGISAPSLLPSTRVRALAALEGKAFAEELAFFGGLPQEIIADEDVLELLLPQVIADFRMAASYSYRPGTPLTIDVSLVNGLGDPHVGLAQLEPWQQECKNPPTCHWAEGGHFYLETQPAFVTDLVRDLVRADNHVELI
jgi:surfactin synthase thioesterase subunit